MILALFTALAELPLVIQIIIIIAVVGVPSYAFHQMVIVPGQEVAGAAADLAGTAADVGGDILKTHGEIVKGTATAVKKAGEVAGKAGKAVVKGVTKECRDGFQKVGLDCLVKCPHGTSGLYCKKHEYKVSKAKKGCDPGYTKLKWPYNRICQAACPKYTEKDWTGGCKRKPERHWF